MREEDQEILDLIAERKKKREEAATLEQPGNPFADLLLGIGGGYASALAGNGQDYAGKALAAKKAGEDARQAQRIKALDAEDQDIKWQIDLAKARQTERLADKRLQYAENREDRRTEKALATQEKKDMARLQELAGGLRKEYIGLPTTKQTQDVSASIERVRQAGNNPSAAGDLGLIFNYMKMLDPGSTVREGEFANAQNAAGVPEQVRNLWNRAKSGERLSDAQRQDFMAQAERQYQAQLDAQKNFETQYTELATRLGVSPKDVLMTFTPAQIKEAQGGAGGGGIIPNANAGQSKLTPAQESRRQQLLQKKAQSQGAAQ